MPPDLPKVHLSCEIRFEFHGDFNYKTIDGNIHSNTKIDMDKAILVEGSLATAVTSVKIASGSTATTLAIEMPSAHGLIGSVKSNCYTFDGDVVLKKNKYSFQDMITEAYDAVVAAGTTPAQIASEGLNIYINGSLTENGNGASYHNSAYPINLVVKGNVTLNGTELTSTVAAPIILISENGGVEINGGGAGYAGIVFAPKGDVTINGNDVSYTGSIIAQNIVKNGGKISVTYSDEVDNHLPKGKVRLIE